LKNRWAAKEAAIKAYANIRPIRKHNIAIISRGDVNGTSQAPTAYVTEDTETGYRRVVIGKAESEDEGVDNNEAEGKQERDIHEEQEVLIALLEKHGEKDRNENKVTDIDAQETTEVDVKDAAEADVKDAAETDAKKPTYAKAKREIIQISISHDGEYATAVCLAAG
jgi:phosphopantetheinyl transferase (holo-ACP synthase)